MAEKNAIQNFKQFYRLGVTLKDLNVNMWKQPKTKTQWK